MKAHAFTERADLAVHLLCQKYLQTWNTALIKLEHGLSHISHIRPGLHDLHHGSRLAEIVSLGCYVSFLTVDKLSVRYSAGETARCVLDDVCFAVDGREIVGLSGPSGSGKTTVALALLGLLPDEATVSGGIAIGDPCGLSPGCQ